MTDWVKRYFALAEHVAQWSKDPDTKVGCVIVGKNRREMSVGYNGFPTGVADTPERLGDRDLKRKLIQHAERNALDNVRFDCSGGLLVTTMFPCSECVKSIISRKITNVICPAPLDRPPWKDDADLSSLMLRESGVAVWDSTKKDFDGDYKKLF